MYFDFEDYHPDISPVGSAISWREGVLLSIIVHLAAVIVLLLFPQLLTSPAGRAPALVLQQPRDPSPTFVFVQPRLDTPAPRPPDRGEASDLDRVARAPQRAPRPTNELPFSRGNTPERVEEIPSAAARGQGPAPDPTAGEPAPTPSAPQNQLPPLSNADAGLRFPTSPPQASNHGMGGNSPVPGGLLRDAMRNLQRYTATFNNPQGGGGEFGPDIQFDTKGVEFGPWIRRFIAQVKRNWIIPYSAMSNRGHVVITFNVHKDGTITDLSVAGPSSVDAFNNAAFGALASSNPTQPLPPEYPSEKAFFTVSFFYNETPP